MVHFIIEAVDRLTLKVFQINHRISSAEQFPPHMMISLLIYCYANSIFSSREIERATYRDVSVRYITGDHDTICTFRRKNFTAISEAFVDVLELARELKLLKLGNIDLDGTYIKANASIDKNVTYERAVEIREQLTLDIAELMSQAEKADQKESDSQKLPDEIVRREKLVAKMDGAIEELKKRAAKQEDRAKKKYQKNLERRKKHKAKTGKKPRGYEPKEP